MQSIQPQKKCCQSNDIVTKNRCIVAGKVAARVRSGPPKVFTNRPLAVTLSLGTSLITSGPDLLAVLTGAYHRSALTPANHYREMWHCCVLGTHDDARAPPAVSATTLPPSLLAPHPTSDWWKENVHKIREDFFHKEGFHKRW